MDRTDVSKKSRSRTNPSATTKLSTAELPTWRILMGRDGAPGTAALCRMASSLAALVSAILASSNASL
jgi:hypothetical protein